MNYIALGNGVKMPQLGYGVFQISPEDCERCVADALRWSSGSRVWSRSEREDKFIIWRIKL